MAKGIGRLVQFGIARETTRGTVESAATYYIPWDDLEIDEKDERVAIDQSRGVIEASIGEEVVKQYAMVTLKAPVTDKSFPLVLYSVLGSLSTGDNADSDASIKDHTITVAQSAQHQALSLFVDDPIGGQDYKHALGVPTSLEINYERGKFMDYSVAFKAKKGADATLTPSATSESRFRPHHVTFKMASAQSGLDAANATSIKSFKIKFDPHVEDDDVLGSISPGDFHNKEFTVDGSVELTFADETIKDIALANTAKAFRIDIQNTDVTIGNAANPRIKIDLHSVTLQPITRSIKKGDIVIQTFAFKAHYSTADSKLITVVATNAVASY